MEQNIRQAEKMSRNIERASRAIKVYICMLIQFCSMDCTCIPLKNMLPRQVYTVFSLLKNCSFFSYAAG